VDAQKQFNHLAGKGEAEYLKLRRSKDLNSAMPKLMLHALQANIRGGRRPEPESDSRRYLPVDIPDVDHATD
jgi:hypothetical protein